MNKRLMESRSLWGFFYVISFFISLYLTSRHSYLWSGDADAANSPLVWREFLDKGWYVFSQWKPTFDNWYFTVYPVNFILFLVFGDDGITPLLLSSVIFIFTINIIATSIIRKMSGNMIAILSLLFLTFISPDLYRHGYLSHPFSHNSTNAYGFVVFLLYLLTFDKKNIFIPILCSFISLLSSVSDPWFLAAFFLPLIITESIVIFLTKKNKYNLLIYLCFFVIAERGVVQNILDLPTHGFSIASFDQIISNLNTAIILIAKILPLSNFDNAIAVYISFLVWLISILYALCKCLKKGGMTRVVAIFSFLSIIGIFSSSIIGDQIPHQRFYLNIIPMVIILCLLPIKIGNGKFLLIPLIVMFLTSFYLYLNANLSINVNKNPVDEYISFLEKNNLKYGYGSFWGMTMGVNWLSGGDIHITPVYFDNKTGVINFKNVRVQTMKFWHTKEFINSKPSRQFIVLRKGKTGDQCMDINICKKGIEKTIGEADELLNYNGMLIMIYNNPINTGI